MLLHPAFPEKELERLRVQRLALLRQADNPKAVAGVVFPRLLYGAKHPYGRPTMGTPKSVEALTRDDVVAFHKRLFLPNNASLIVVGRHDARRDHRRRSRRPSRTGSPASRPRRACPSPRTPKAVTVYLVDKPGAAQSVLAVGQVGVPAEHARLLPARR